MNKRSDGKRRRKSRSKRSKRCKSLLSRKIGINIHEGIYANKAQAIAVAYSQVRKRHPSCRRILGKKSRRRSKRRRSKRRIMDGLQIVGTGNNGFLSENQKTEFRNIFQDNQSIIEFNNIKFQQRIPNTTQYETFTYTNIKIKTHLTDSYKIVVNNQQILEIPIIFYISRIINYEL
jgi:hypothetical protein